MMCAVDAGPTNDAARGPVPMVSVIVPTRNRSALMERAVHCALAQERVSFEVIVVDDASEDDTAERLARLDDPRVTCISLDERGGPARARNAGIRAATGKWLAFLDDDDLWAPTKLRCQLDAAAATGASFVYTNAVRVDRDLKVTGKDGRLLPPMVMRDALLSTNPMPGGGSGPIADAGATRRLGGFDEELFTMADWDLWIRLAQAVPTAVCPAHTVAYLVHEQSMILEDLVDIEAEFAYIRNKHGALARQSGQRLNGLEFYRALALVHWRGGHRWNAAWLLARGLVWHAHPANLALARNQLGRALRRTLLRRRPPDPTWLALYRADA